MKTITTQLQNIFDLSIKTAKAAGATDVEVSASKGEGYTVSVRQKEVEKIEYHRDQRFQVTVLFGTKEASSGSTDFSLDSILSTTKAACEIAQAVQEDPFNGMPERELLAYDYPLLDLYFPCKDSVEDSTRLAIDCETIGLNFDKRITNSNGVSITSYKGKSYYATTDDFYGEGQGTTHSISCSLIAGEGDSMQTDYEYSNVRDYQDLMKKELVAENAANNVIHRLDPKPIKTGHYPIIFLNRQAKSIFGTYLAAISGGNLYRKASFLVDALGQDVFSDIINITEHPFLAKAIGSAAFDGEGVKVSEKKLVTKGVLDSYLLGTYSAKKLGMRSTGNAGGAFNPTVGSTGQSFEELLKMMGNGVLVTELMGNGTNLVTGDYSHGAAGFWVENGEIKHAVQGITIAGNLKEIFKGISAVATDQDINGNLRTGSILIDQMMVGS
jgi:PmbA protein